MRVNNKMEQLKINVCVKMKWVKYSKMTKILTGNQILTIKYVVEV